ncbi:MAG: ATPase [Candidatus Kaiserbacteria bacterium]|nr:ATPase [Candidatus Kaiserbacteria bacterium]
MEKAITIERTVDAPIEKVWKAWTDPKELMQWWGPNNVSIPECEVDLRVGGKFYIVMEAGEAMGPYKGTKWPMLAEFTEVEPNAKLSYTAQAWTEGMKEETLIDQTTEIVLREVDGKTKIEIKAAILKTGPKAGMAVQGMEAGFTQQLEKLATYIQ